MRRTRLGRTLPGGVVALSVLTLLVLAAPAGPRAAEPAARRVVLVSLDGAADWMFDRLLEQGKAPAFAELARDGAVAEAALSTVPSLTSVAHATIWTGAPPSVTGVSGNAVLVGPPGEHTILEKLSGFESQARRAQPIWEAAARAGKRALVLQGTGAYPFPNPALANELLFDVYGWRLSPAQLVTGSLVAGQYSLDTPAGPAVLSPGEGGGLQVAAGGRSWTISTTGGPAWTPPIAARVGDEEGAFTIGLLDYSAVTGAFMLVRGQVLRISSSDPAEVAPFRALAGTLVDEGSFVGWYQHERLGPTLASGGTGRAEERLVALSAAAQSYSDGALAYASGREWDLLVCYSPVFDAFAHAMVGIVDPDSSRSNPALAERAWPHLERAFAITVDRFVADIRRRFPDATLIVTSDHGMEGTGRVVFPNVILKQAGLLELDANGAIDLARTKAAVLDQRAGLVTLNTADRKGGIVPAAERAILKRQVATALLGARDPDTGAPVIRAVLDADVDGAALGFSAEGGADLVLDPSPDYAIYVDASGSLVAAASKLAVGEGKHGPLPTRRRLQGIFFAAGPGVAPGLRLPLVRLTDVAPTVARLLGIPPPAQATGAPIVLDRNP
jgi:predicted AlkP superfamily phosphohydrolase/phosphomutase